MRTHPLKDNVLFRTDNGLRLKSTPATGGGARRLMFRDTAMLGVGIMQGMVAISGRDFVINQTDLGGQYTQSPFIFTLAYTAGDSTIVAASESAQFKDINVTRVSVDNGKPGQGGSFITVDGYDGRDSKLRFPETFQQNLVSEFCKQKLLLKLPKYCRHSSMLNSQMWHRPTSVDLWQVHSSM